MAGGISKVEVSFSQESKRILARMTEALDRHNGVEVKYVIDKSTEQDPDVRYRVFDLLTKESDLPPLSTVSANAIISRLENNGIRFVDSEG